LPTSFYGNAETSHVLQRAALPVAKKLAIVLSVLLTGVGMAHCFRKDASPQRTTERVIESPAFREPVARRLIPAPPPRASAAEENPPAITTPFRIPLVQTQAGPADEPQLDNSRLHRELSPASSMFRPLDLDEDAEAAFARPTTPSKLATPSTQVRSIGFVAHKIGDGDTLSGIAAKYLGRADRYLEIYNANRDVLRSPDLLPIGKTLKIPNEDKAEMTLDAPQSMP
jgi:nucleoid-associated protein YgaU